MSPPLMEVAAASTPVNTEPTPSTVALNLNELPSSTSLNQPLPADHPNSLSVVLAFLNHLTPPAGPQPELPRDFNGSDCSACGLPEVKDQMVVCDGCERGFHLDCARIQGKRKQPVDVKFVDNWMCAECVSNAVPCDRWPLGFKAKAPGNKNGSLTLPFINGEGEGTDDLPDSRKHSPGDNSFGGDRFGVPVTYLNLPHGENVSNFKEASHALTPCFKLGFEDRRLHTLEVSGIFGEVNLHSQSEVLRGGSQTGIRMQSQSPEEIHLEALREYILERHGSLAEAWSVKLKQSRNSDEPHAIYCSPDGKTFQSMSEVACYLGLMPKRGRKRKNEYGSPELGAQLSRRRKSARFSAASDVAESKEAPLGSLPKEESSTSQTSGVGGKFGDHVEETGGDEARNLDDRLPVQLEDFFVLSFGKIDLRPAYHNADRIWPVGYKSCWHDKITGSVFVCEVSDGGDSGPIFTVRRFSCSTFAIPSSSTVLCWENLGKSDGKGEEKIVDHDEDYNVMRFLAEPSPPGEHDVFSCLGSSFNECPDLQTSNEVQLEALASCGRFENVPSDNVVWKDEVGSFSVEECSASSAWRRVSEKFNDFFCAMYKQNGNVRFFCEHVSGGMFTSTWDVMHESCEDQFAPLAKFHGSMHHSNIPTIIQDDKDMKNGSEFLVKWLDQDRFGLDMEFVQEFVERLPGAAACSRYVVCNDRSSPTSSLMLGNGILQIKTKDVGLARYDEIFHKLSEGHKSPKKQMGEDPVVISHSFPPGKPISSRLPSQCVGNVLEAHEFLCRFHEVLGLREPLSFEELEEELIHPWLGGLDLLEKTGREFKESQDRAMPCGSSCGHILSSNLDSGSVVSSESPHVFIPTETRAMRDAAKARMTSLTYMGYALTKAHKSLLSVLISELQLRVSAVIDPNVDGESKPKRGRKKDTDVLITGKRAKFNLLPLNELTWPEMARRYSLAFLSMGYDWFDINTRESAKIFRCLQGDGGFLCGSKTGVVGKEEDAKLLAGSIKRIFGSSDRDGDILYMEDTSDGTSSCKSVAASDYHVPEWVKVLEPVKKLPTNVGARIRNRVNDALKLGPPEWAKISLERCISKGVYKGNASGPTKRAVLEVLGRVSAEIMFQKPNRQKPDMKSRKKLALISEIIMRKCRIVLRRAVAVDAKDINRRKLINGTDNDDEGILDSPTMVSRPLDFRIIDLRLAAGAYGGSHDTFLEDVRELWNNRRITHADQPNLVELAGELSTNFESLYKQEVITLFGTLVEYAKSESLSAESKKEVEGLLDSMLEIPKASWEEGVCKVCGIDKDDNSVLLCDQCDAEYHMYCLNPPLARIPNGNWYCPSCASGGCLVPDAPECAQGIFLGLKKFRGKVTCDYVEPLSHLASSLEEREYWELSADERIFMLKFLCDELLNSSLVRHHLEQSLETSTDLMQKVRSLSGELKNLKSKEERLAARAAKVDRGFRDAVADVPNEEGFGSAPETNDTCVRDLRMRSDQHNFIGAEDQAKSVQIAECEVVIGDSSAEIALSKNGRTCEKKLISSDISDALSDELEKPTESDNYMMFSSVDMQGFSAPPDTGSILVQEGVPLIDGNKSQPVNLELTSVRNEIVLLQNSIASMERQLARLSARREFLGNDSVGRFYWGFSELGTHKIVVNGNKEFQCTERMTLPTNKGSRASCPYLRDRDGDNPSCCTWVSYQSDSEIKDLVEFLKINDHNGRKLIDSILDWQERRFQGFRQNEIHTGKPLMACTRSEDCEKSVSSTIAATLLQSKYGPFSELDVTEHLKNHRKAKATTEQKMFRCECLEPVWPSRHHCLFCHRTFSTVMEFEGHRGCNCNVVSSVSVKSKKCADMIERKGESTENAQERMGGVIRSQSDGLACPFNFEDICSKFLIASSNKQLVSEIGLIGSNGIPSFVASTSPYLNDPTLVLVSPKDLGVQSDKHAANHLVLSDVEKMTNDSLKCAMTEVTGPPEANEADANFLVKNDQKSTLPNTAPLVEGRTSCVVPSFSSRPLVGRARHILRDLKINLLDMEAALPEEGMRPYRASSEKRWAWRAFVKSVETIYEMVQATIVFEDMIKSEYLTRMWWYWSSVSAAAKISTVSHLALRIYSLDAAIDYEKFPLGSSRTLDKNQQSHLQSTEKNKVGRKPNKKKKEAEA